jgi:hypothetical protein
MSRGWNADSSFVRRKSEPRERHVGRRAQSNHDVSRSSLSPRGEPSEKL